MPDDWPEWQRRGFLAWLAGPAGLLVDRADGTLTFTHLSFQEYLAAWFLNSNVEGSDRIAEFKNHLVNLDWWETLRLWAAMIDRANPARLDPILSALIDQGEVTACSLAGTLFADGLGKPERFQAWLAQWIGHLSWGIGYANDTCTRAWSATRQAERRSDLLKSLADGSQDQTWLGWLRYQEFAGAIGLKGQLPRPETLLGSTVIAEIYDEGQPTSSWVAAGRILNGVQPLWSLRALEVGLLQLWPGPRRIVGHQLQLMICCGAAGAALEKLVGSLSGVQGTPRADDRAREEARHGYHVDVRNRHRPELARPEAREWNRDLNRDLARDLARYWARYQPDSQSRHLTYYWVRDAVRNWVRSVTRNVPRHSSPDLFLGRPLGLDAEIHHRCLADFAGAEIASSGRSLARVALAWDKDLPLKPNVALLSAACQLSLHPKNAPLEFERALAEYPRTEDTLWPALARHLARRATDDDRALLTDLAQHPEHREPPLSWGLQFIVRGDVLLDDGSVLLLDDLTDKAGLPRLPYLEEMPDELEVDWDAED